MNAILPKKLTVSPSLLDDGCPFVSDRDTLDRLFKKQDGTRPSFCRCASSLLNSFFLSAVGIEINPAAVVVDGEEWTSDKLKTTRDPSVRPSVFAHVRVKTKRKNNRNTDPQVPSQHTCTHPLCTTSISPHTNQKKEKHNGIQKDGMHMRAMRSGYLLIVDCGHGTKGKDAIEKRERCE